LENFYLEIGVFQPYEGPVILFCTSANHVEMIVLAMNSI
jgi:hypothetical protein